MFKYGVACSLNDVSTTAPIIWREAFFWLKKTFFFRYKECFSELDKKTPLRVIVFSGRFLNFLSGMTLYFAVIGRTFSTGQTAKRGV